MKNLTEIIATLSHYQPIRLPETSSSAAVIIILLKDAHDHLEIVLTKRAETLPTYAGQYSFPGGIRDPGDADWYETATREVQEELNLSDESYQYVGELDDFPDRYNNLVRVFVVLMHKEDFLKNYKISADEIAEIYFFSLEKLTQLKDDPNLHIITRRRPSYAFTEGVVFVWGLTAAILVRFREVIAA